MRCPWPDTVESTISANKIVSRRISPASPGAVSRFLGLDVALTDREHLIGQRRRCHPIATVNRRHRTIQQLINRCNPTVAHINSVPLPAAHTRHIAGDQLGQPD